MFIRPGLAKNVLKLDKVGLLIADPSSATPSLCTGGWVLQDIIVYLHWNTLLSRSRAAPGFAWVC